MRYLVTGKEMSLYDKQTSEHFHIPSVVLMEQAAHAFVEQFMREVNGNDQFADAGCFQSADSVMDNKSSKTAIASISGSYHILVVCGTGNNGGDGIAIARLLNQRGIYTEIYAPVEGHRTSELFDLQYKIYQAYGYPVREQLKAQNEKITTKSSDSADDTIASSGSVNEALARLNSDSEGYFSYAPESKTCYDIVIDAIFGTGLSKPITGKWADVIECMNAMPGRKIAVDIASGVSADTGEVLGTAFRADETITFSFAKLGQYLWPGASCSGKVTVVPIGITEESFLGTAPHVRAMEACDLCRLPSRKPNSHKGTYGKLLVIAGSAQMAGAAIFAAKAAYRMGIGLVKVMTPESNRVIIQTQVPEAILSTYPDGLETVYECSDNKPGTAPESNSSDNLEKIVEINNHEAGQEWNSGKYHELHEQIRKELAWADALVIGPGIGTGETAAEILRQVLEESKIPMVLDADALNIISREGWQLRLSYTSDRYQSVPTENTGSRQDVSAKSKDNNQFMLTDGKILHQDVKPRDKVIITPHMGEMSRLTGKPTDEIKAHICEEASRFSADYQVVCVLKDARTVTATPDGRLYLNLSGNNGMATAGSGDVLSGILGGLLAQGLDPAEAAPLGVYFHGRAGDTARDRLGARYMMASDIIEGMSNKE